MCSRLSFSKSGSKSLISKIMLLIITNITYDRIKMTGLKLEFISLTQARETRHILKNYIQIV